MSNIIFIMLPHKYIVLFILFGFTRRVSLQIPVFRLYFKDELESRLGIGWPTTLKVAKGHSALIKLNRILVNQESCEIRTASGQTINVNSIPSSSRYESWGDGCGIRIKNITKADEGRWRITSTREQESLVGFAEIYVVDPNPRLEDSVIYLEDGANADINLTTMDNYYCMVTQPFAHSTLVPGHCEVALERTSRAVQGVWNVLLGLPGHVPEVPLQREVTVKAEQLDVGFIRDTVVNKLHLYCNIKYTHKNITFCRFQRVADSSGHNVIDGLSDGHYSYFGEGFVKKHCGISIETPNSHDFSTWRCSVGVQELVENHVVQRSPMQALISVTENTFSGRIIPKRMDEDRKVFTQIGSELQIDCHVNEALSYCWFQSPNGTQFTPVLDGDMEDLTFWYSGESLQMGDCSITFADAHESLSGLWTCHMGSRNNLGIEIIDSVTVRVAGPLTANKQMINSTIYGKETLYCHTSGVVRSIMYCRFVSPDFVGINIDPSITVENAIMGRYYFSPNRSLDYGDCSMTIDPVLSEDLGNWTCAALIAGFNSESRDFIYLAFKDTSNLTAGSIAAITFAVIALISVSVAALIYRNILYDCIRRPSPRTVSMQAIVRTSTASDSSNESIPQSIPSSV